jgi:hypothetical protein
VAARIHAIGAGDFACGRHSCPVGAGRFRAESTIGAGDFDCK